MEKKNNQKPLPLSPSKNNSLKEFILVTFQTFYLFIYSILFAISSGNNKSFAELHDRLEIWLKTFFFFFSNSPPQRSMLKLLEYLNSPQLFLFNFFFFYYCYWNFKAYFTEKKKFQKN